MAGVADAQAVVAGRLRQCYLDDAGEQAIEVSPVRSGRNQVFRCTDGRDVDWIVKLAGVGQGEGVARESLLLTQLAAQGSLAVRPVAPVRVAPDDCAGAMLVLARIDARPARDCAADYASLGAAAARLHGALDHVGIDCVEMPLFEPAAIVSSAVADVGSALGPGPQRAALERLGNFIDAGLAGMRMHWDDPRICHGDLHPHNVLLPPGRDPVWIDFEDAFIGPRLYDVATIVWSSFNQTHAAPLWQAALGAYTGITPLSAGVLNCLGLFVALRQVWWLSLHARHWGAYPMHAAHPQLLDDGVDLLDAICRDACGLTS